MAECGKRQPKEEPCWKSDMDCAFSGKCRCGKSQSVLLKGTLPE